MKNIKVMTEGEIEVRGWIFFFFFWTTNFI